MDIAYEIVWAFKSVHTFKIMDILQSHGLLLSLTITNPCLVKDEINITYQRFFSFYTSACVQFYLYV